MFKDASEDLVSISRVINATDMALDIVTFSEQGLPRNEGGNPDLDVRPRQQPFVTVSRVSILPEDQTDAQPMGSRKCN